MPRDKDWQTAGWSALATWLAVWFSGSLAILIDWKFAPLAALGIGNFVMLLSSMERPQIMGPKIFQGACAGVLAAMNESSGDSQEVATILMSALLAEVEEREQALC